MPESGPARSLAWTGVLLGTAGLFVLNLVFGPIAIGLGVAAHRRGTHRLAAVTAIALGLADVILEVVLATIWFHHDLSWHFGG